METQVNVVLRPHQQQLVDATLQKLQTDRFALGVMAVASGKSYAAATIAKHFKRVVVIQPSVELIRQNHISFEKLGIENVMIDGTHKGDWSADVILTTANTLYKHLDDLEEPDLLIIDELHLQHWGKMRKTIMKQWTHCKCFGMTATPHYYVQRIEYKSGGMWSVTECCAIADGYFGEPVFSLSREQMKELGYGADIQIKRVKISKVRGYYFDSPEIYDPLLKAHAEQVKQLTKGLKNGIIYCDSVSHAKYLCDNLDGCEMVTGTTPAKDRKGIIDRFVSGTLPFIATVGCLKIGFDKPDLENIIILTNVKNPSNAEQQIGRLNRGSGLKTCWYNSILNTAEPIVG
ncbi:MAG: DEAD/DEAH box helicase family protein, partial [Alphaproteobacteria bacterium]|nr:DEAD/DEAH box helicase family protein [Alphaproteobacteria bacterium]